MKRNLTAYWRLIRADKPIGTLLLLWPTLAAVWIAGHGHPPLFILFIFIMGVFLMRSVVHLVYLFLLKVVSATVSFFQFIIPQILRPQILRLQYVTASNVVQMEINIRAWVKSQGCYFSVVAYWKTRLVERGVSQYIDLCCSVRALVVE